MRKKKLERTSRDYSNEWLGLSPQDHLNQPAAVIGAVLAEGDDAVTRGGQLAHAQTHLLAGVLKTQLSGGGVAGYFSFSEGTSTDARARLIRSADSANQRM